MREHAISDFRAMTNCDGVVDANDVLGVTSRYAGQAAGGGGRPSACPSYLLVVVAPGEDGFKGGRDAV